MRILVVATDIVLPGRHGGSTHVRELVDNLGDHGETLLLACEGSSGAGIAPVGRPMRRFPAALRHADAVRTFVRAREAVERFKPDVIYERATSYGVGAMIARERGIPSLTMVLDRRFSWFSLWQADRIVSTVPERVVPAAVRHKAVKVSWGANERRFAPDVDGAPARERHGLRDVFVVGYAGTFRPWHGIDGLVRAAARLDEGVRYLLIGDGPGYADIRAQVDAAGLADRFVFTGAVDYDDVPGLLAACDIAVAPFEPKFHKGSGPGGFVLDPLKVFEYLALGKPSITVREPNIEALFRDGEDLLLTTPGADDQLANAIDTFRNDRGLAQRTAESGRAKVLAKYTWGAHARQLAQLFEQMLAERT